MLSPRPCHLVKGDTETDKETDKEEEEEEDKVKEKVKEKEKVKKEEKDKEEEKDGDPSPGSEHLAAPTWVTEIRQNELFRKVRQKIDTD